MPVQQRQPFIPADWKDPVACPPREVNTKVVPDARVIPTIDAASPWVWSRLPREMAQQNEQPCIKFDSMSLTALQVNGKKYAAVNGVGHTGCTAANFLDLSLYTCVDFKVEPCAITGTDAESVKNSMQVWVNAGTVVYTSIDPTKIPNTRVATYVWPAGTKGVDAGKNKRDLMPGTAPTSTKAGFWKAMPSTPYDFVASTNPLVTQSRAERYGGTTPATDSRDQGECISLPALPAVIVWKPPAWIPQWEDQNTLNGKGTVQAYPLSQTLDDRWVVIAMVDEAGTIAQAYCGGPVHKFNLDYSMPGPYVRLETRDPGTAPFHYDVYEAFNGNGVLVENLVLEDVTYKGGDADASAAGAVGFLSKDRTAIEWCNEERGGSGGDVTLYAEPFNIQSFNVTTGLIVIGYFEFVVGEEIHITSGDDSTTAAPGDVVYAKIDTTDWGVKDIDAMPLDDYPPDTEYGQYTFKPLYLIGINIIDGNLKVVRDFRRAALPRWS